MTRVNVETIPICLRMFLEENTYKAMIGETMLLLGLAIVLKISLVDVL